MQFSDMVTRVGELINQSVSDDTLDVSNTEVKANLNIGYKQCINAVVALNQNYYQRLTKANLVASQELYALPSDCRKLVRLEVAYETTTDRVAATAADINEFAKLTDQQSFGSPMYFVTGKMFQLNPAATSNVTNGLWFWYIEDPAELSADSSEPNLPAGYEHLPILYATAKAKLKLGLIVEHDKLIGEFKGELQIMQDEVSERNISVHDRVVVMDIG